MQEQLIGGNRLKQTNLQLNCGIISIVWASCIRGVLYTYINACQQFPHMMSSIMKGDFQVSIN